MRAFYLVVFLILSVYSYGEEYVYGNVLVLPSHLYSIVVSKSHQKTVVLQIKDGYPVVVDEFISATGLRFGDKIKKGDMRTPSGVYFPVSFKPDSQLPPYYGAGAFPLNYPNALDRYVIRRDGDGIWIHGYGKKELLFFSSKGCIILKNNDLERLSGYIKLGKTPVVVQERFVKLPLGEFKSLRKEAEDFIEKWKDALLKLYRGDDTQLYKLYSRDFYSSAGTRYDQINLYKKLFYAEGDNEPFIVLLNKTVLFDERENGKRYIVAGFQMGFLSGDELKSMKKVLYIRLNGEKPEIISEENF
ncbi:L,D-transpeptidase family protein [Persephonella sp.]